MRVLAHALAFTTDNRSQAYSAVLKSGTHDFGIHSGED